LALLIGCPEQCKKGFRRCGEACVDITSDNSYCGACDLSCPRGAGCVAGVCACPSGQSACGNECVDLTLDPRHCGACQHSCGLGRCDQRACVCNSGAIPCADTCVDLQSNPEHCGACDVACGLVGQACDAGVCGCPSPTIVCANACVDTRSDARNCDRCGLACGANQVCIDSACVCPATLPDTCNGRCVALSKDPANCGRCGAQCAPSELCDGGCTCAAGAQRCATGDGGAACVDLTTASDCGGCGRACAEGASCEAQLSADGGDAGIDCACPMDRPMACRVSGADRCCAGTGCCSSGCQSAHDNGLGQTYFDCQPIDTYSLTQAMAAAAAWAPTGVDVLPAPACPDGCLCRTDGPLASATRAAVFCYASTFKGYVAVTQNPSCAAATCPSINSPSTSQWH
jgi:hypothetical protein